MQWQILALRWIRDHSNGKCFLVLACIGLWTNTHAE